MASGRAQRGFTLVEVLVALAIMASVAAAILALIAQNTRFVASTEEQMIAGLAADREMVELLARSAPLERGDEQGARELAGRTFVVMRTVTEIAIEGLVRIDVEIRDQSGRQVLASATTIKAEAP